MNGIGKSTALQRRKALTHICGLCGRMFAKKEHVRRHVLSHTGEKPFKCPDCARQFARQDILSRHRKKVHARDSTLLRNEPRRIISSETQACNVDMNMIGYSASTARKTQTIPTLASHDNPSFSGTPRIPPSLDGDFDAQRFGIEGSQVEITLPDCALIRCNHQRAPTRRDPLIYEANDFYNKAYPIASTGDSETTAYGKSVDTSLYNHAETISPSMLHTGASVLAPDADQVPSQISWLCEYATTEPRRGHCSLGSIRGMIDAEAFLTVPSELNVCGHANAMNNGRAQQIGLACCDEVSSPWLENYYHEGSCLRDRRIN